MRRLITIVTIVLIPVGHLQAAHIAIIIDDLGHNVERGKRAIELPGPVTVSILPYTRHSRHLAETAHRHGKEVMMHLPMANISNLPIGPGGLDAAQLPKYPMLAASITIWEAISPSNRGKWAG